MTVDIRAEARDEAFMNHYSHKQVPDRYDADLLIEGFQAGAVWAQAQLTPTREQIAEVVQAAESSWQELVKWNQYDSSINPHPGNPHEFAADAVLALLQEQAGSRPI